MLGNKLILLLVKVTLHVLLLNNVRLLHGSNVGLMLFYQSGDLGTKLIYLITGIGS